MALVNGPLFSLSASGQLGKALVYSRWKGRDYVREYVIPANPRTLPQFLQRGLLTAASRWWAGLANDTGAQESWIGAASAQGISTFNAMVAAAIDRMGLDLAPIGNDDGGSGFAQDTVSTVATSPEPGRLLVTVTVDGTADLADLLVMSIGEDGGINTTAGHWNRVLSGQSNVVGTSATFDISNIPPGVYFIGGNVVGTDGVEGTWIYSSSAVTVS